MTGLRLVSVARLSREDEQSGLSIDAQHDRNLRWIKDNGNFCVGQTSDRGVSGEMPMRRRPDVGQWLTDERLDDWDGFVGAESSRLFRDLADSVMFFVDFMREPRNKLVFTADGEIDMSTPKGVEDAFGEFLANQRELRKIKERNKGSAEYYRARGLWHGGKVPFGRRPKRQGDHWILAIHDEHATIIKEIADEVIAGKSVSQAARELTARQIPTGWSSKKKVSTVWRPGPLIRILRSKDLIGYVPYNFRKDGTYDLARDAEGQLIRRDEILDERTWYDLQAALERPDQPGRNGKRSDASRLLNFVYCGNPGCGAKLYYNKFKRTQQTGKVDRYAYYTCSADCGARGIIASDLEARISRAIKANDSPAVMRRIVRGKNHDAELEVNQEQQYHLLAIQDGLTQDEFRKRMDDLLAERKRLRELRPEPAREEPVGLGQTYGDLWLGMDDAARRAFLLGLAIRLYVFRDEAGGLTFRTERDAGAKRIWLDLDIEF